MTGQTNRRTIALIAIVLFVGNVADLILTRYALGLGAVEGNPIMAPIVEGWYGFALKVGFVGLVAWLAAKYVRTQWVTWLFAAVAFVYAAIVVWNAGVIYLTVS